LLKSELIETLVLLGKEFEVLKRNEALINKAHTENQWFTPDFQAVMMNYWSSQLQRENLNSWLNEYSYTDRPKNIGLIMAGNIPLVGLHDLICILCSGHFAMIKPSSEDTTLVKWVTDTLIKLNPALMHSFEYVDKLNTCEALIATGSNNTSRYFEYYFSSIPRLIRKNRNSLAVITGNETEAELQELAKDIFLYFGLGCRNVSKLWIPENYDFNKFFEALESFNFLKNHNKYFNNYTYHKAILLMNLAPHLDNGFLLVKEDSRLSSPLGCLFYSVYKERFDIIDYIDNQKDSIQIVLGDKNFISEALPFGQSQFPELNSYADEIDTLQFLNEL